jgi:tetratricopeptide (TPR) repeat protein
MTMLRFAFPRVSWFRAFAICVCIGFADRSARADDGTEESSQAEAPQTTTATAATATAATAPNRESSQAFLERFASSLMRERDYFRAITVYKQLRFASTNSTDRVHYALEIGTAYRRGQRYASALSMLPLVLNDASASPEQKARAELVGGESYLGLKVPYQAEVLLNKSILDAPQGSELKVQSSLVLGAALADRDDLDGAKQQFARASQSPRYENAAKEMMQLTDKAASRQNRSPLAAALFSAVLPGAGQAFSGHWVDAAQALFFVGAFGFTSYLAYSYEHEKDRPLVLTTVALSITGLFHVANILGAERTARYYNQRQRDVSIGAIRERALSLP